MTKINQQQNKVQFPYLGLGVKILLVFLLVLLIWAAFAPINSSIIASGEIILNSNKKTVSHLSGGIIKQIKIKEGEQVEANQELIILDTVQVEAKISQNQEAIKAAEFQKIATSKKINSLQQEIRIVDQLLKNANSSLTRKLDLQKQLNEAEGKLGELTANLASLKSEYEANQDILAKTVIRAPAAGYVMDLKHQTIGGVIAPASEIMFIVPKDDQLIAEVKIKPADIDLLNSQMTALVQLTAYKSKLMPKLEGKLINISADAFKNEVNHEIYFKARIAIPETELQKLKADIKLTPGMPVTAFIITGSRTMLQYLLSPISDSAYKAFREE